MNKLLVLLLPLAIMGASCVQLPEQFSAQSVRATQEVKGQHFVLDLYSNRDEQDNLSYHEQLEVWYAADRAARVDVYSFDEQATPFLANRAYYDVTSGQLYMEVDAKHIEGALIGTEPKPQPYIDEVVDAPVANSHEFIDALLGDILATDSNWLSTHDADYTITQRTDDGSGYETIKEFTIDHITNEINAVTERNSVDNRPFSRIVVSKRDSKRYDPTFFTLQGWRNSLSDPNLPLESELLMNVNQ